MPLDPKEIDEIPRLPGVYIMKDSRGAVLYVGKAKDLRTRLRAYVRAGGDGRHAMRFLLQRVRHLEYIVTATEKEALILENDLIKKHRPRYNVAFRDDKNYLHIRIDPSETFPRLSLVRRPRSDGALYFGPYVSSRSVRETVRLLQRHMGIRTCKDTQMKRGGRSCLQRQMGRCAGVCTGEISQEDYASRVQEAVLFLQGRSKQLVRRMKAQMKEAAKAMRFEEAARIRDRIRALEATLEHQRVATPLGPDRDAVGLARVGEGGVVVVLRVREGHLRERVLFSLEPTPWEDREVLAAFLKRFYGLQNDIPPEILVPLSLGGETPPLRVWLSERAGHPVRISCPRRGKGMGLVEMARQNAESACNEEAGPGEALEALARRLGLNRVPRVMEGFDISTLGGEEAVGAAVRFVDGRPDTRAYRLYRVRSVGGLDDYAMLYEVLRRHLLRRLREGDPPQLMLVDGGKGQLGVAQAVLQDLGVTSIELVALAKGKESEGEHLFLPGRKDPIPTARLHPWVRCLQHLRDEAHRFAISRHRRARRKARLASPLEEIPGVGPARRRILLRAFGSLRGIREASLEELERVPGIPRSLARVIYGALHGAGPSR